MSDDNQNSVPPVPPTPPQAPQVATGTQTAPAKKTTSRSKRSAASRSTAKPAAQTREPRETATREKTVERKKEWTPPNQTVSLENDDHFVYRWVRESANGEHDPRNMERKRSEGWETVPADDAKVKHLVQTKELNAVGGIIKRGGLVLMRLSREFADQRNRYYTREAELQQQAVNDSLRRESDRRMPLSEEKYERSMRREG